MNDTPTPDNPFHCVVDFDLFRRALTIASEEEERPYITGVFVEPHPAGGALLVATNGHSLICLRDKSAITSPVGGIVKLNRQTLRAVKHATDRVGLTPRLGVSHGRASVVFPKTERQWRKPEFLNLATKPDASVVAHQWDGVVVNATYPDWRRAVPAPSDNAVVAGFNADLICPLAAALVGGGIVARVRIVPGQGEEAAAAEGHVPHLVFGPNHVDGFGVLMPIMHSGIKAALPPWFEGAV